MQTREIITFSIKYPEKDWCKMDTISEVLKRTGKSFDDFENSITFDSLQKTSSLLILKKSHNTLDIIKTWRDIAETKHLVDDSPSILENFHSFKENRHDQTIWSLLTRFSRNTICLEDNKEDSPKPYEHKYGKLNGVINPFIPSRIK